MRTLLAFVLLAVSGASAQYNTVSPDSSTISTTGDAEVKFPPDRVVLLLGVQTRDHNLEDATSMTDASVKKIISAARELGIDASDIQTDFIHVDLSYNNNNSTVIEYYSATKALEIVLNDVFKFETLLHTVVREGANHIYGVEFRTSELRKYRDEARAIAAKAAEEKARDLAGSIGLKVGKPLSISSYSYGGGVYTYCCDGYYGRYNAMAQNVVQNISSGGVGSEGTVALGKISVTATVAMSFSLIR